MQSTEHQPRVAGSEREPHLPTGRLDDGTWVYAPYGAMFAVDGRRRVVCHACGDALAAISAQHARRHGLTLGAYRERFGLNRKQSLVAPVLAEKRRAEGQRRWAENAGVREGLAVGQQMARDGVLYELGAAAQPTGSRRRQGRGPASREGASPALRAHRAGQTVATEERWQQRARALGFSDLDDYLAVRRAEGATAHRVRGELGCGGSVAVRILSRAGKSGPGASD